MPLFSWLLQRAKSRLSAERCRVEASTSPRRKILIVCGAGYVSGKEIVSLNLAEGLRERGYDVNFMVSRWNDGDFLARLSARGFQRMILPLGFISKRFDLYALKCTFHQLVFWPVLVIYFNHLVKRSPTQIVIHTNWHHVLLLLPFLDPMRDIFWLHETIPNATRFAKLFSAIENRTMRIICVSQAVAQSLEVLGIPRGRIAVVHNGVRITARAPCLLTQPVIIFAIIGQIAAWKGHEDVFDALSMLGPHWEGIQLKIFGSGKSSYVESLQRRAAELNVAHITKWCGYVKEQADVFSEVDIVLVPSRSSDPFPTSALEAAAFGRPVICSSRGGLPEIVDHGRTGFVIRPNCPKELANAMNTFIMDRKLILEMGNNARRRAEVHFALSEFAGRIADIVEAAPSGANW